MVKKQCFVISPIGKPGSSIRSRADKVLDQIIRPSMNQCGYTAVRADEIERSGLINSQIVRHTMEDPLVVADLTGGNPNVSYELAIRH